MTGSDTPSSSSQRKLPRWIPATLTAWIGLALLAGIPLGLWAHHSGEAGRWMAPLVFCGDLFVRCLKILIYPIIVTSLVVGVSNVGNLGRLGKLGGRAALYYLTTTAAAALLGLALVNTIRPGVGANLEGYDIPEKARAGMGMSVTDMLKEVFGGTLLDPIHSIRDGDVLTIIAASLLLGVLLVIAGHRAKPVSDAFRLAERTVMGVVAKVMWIAPLGVVGLLIKSLETHGISLLWDLGKYCVTVLVALGIHGGLILPAIVLLVGGMSIRRWILGIRPAVAVAFSTSSSSATLPVTIQACEENLDVPRPVASFVLPLGATMNMDGTALYEAIAAIFVAQAIGLDLTVAQQMIVFVTAMAASIGAAGIPSAGIVTMVMVFEAVGLPLEPLGAIYAVDRVLDMCRTVVNVMGDTVGSVVLARYSATD